MDGVGLATTVPLIIHVLDINDETPIFQDTPIQFVLTQDMRNFTERAFIKVNVFPCFKYYFESEFTQCVRNNVFIKFLILV